MESNKIGENSPVVFFDGVCNLCSQSVQFILKYNTKANLTFASLQSDFALNTIPDHLKTVDSIILRHGDQYYIKSDAVLEIGRYLSGWPRVIVYFSWVPKSVRDMIYDRIAKSRYNWFGRREVCWVPDATLSHRFLD